MTIHKFIEESKQRKILYRIAQRYEDSETISTKKGNGGKL